MQSQAMDRLEHLSTLWSATIHDFGKGLLWSAICFSSYMHYVCTHGCNLLNCDMTLMGSVLLEISFIFNLDLLIKTFDESINSIIDIMQMMLLIISIINMIYCVLLAASNCDDAGGTFECDTDAQGVSMRTDTALADLLSAAANQHSPNSHTITDTIRTCCCFTNTCNSSLHANGSTDGKDQVQKLSQLQAPYVYTVCSVTHADDATCLLRSWRCQPIATGELPPGCFHQAVI